MRTLSSLGSKQLAHRKGRSALTALGIVLGVAILFGVLVSNATTQRGIDDLIEDFTGRSDVLITAAGSFDAKMPAETAERIPRLPDVELVVPSYTIISSAGTDVTEEAIRLTLRGVELESARLIHTYELRDGRFFEPGRPEVIAPASVVEELGLSLGDRFEVATTRGLREVRLVGIMTETGAARSDQGGVAFTSIEAARTLDGAGDVISGARVVLAEGTDVDAWIDEHAGALGPGLDVENAARLAQGFKEFVAILGVMFTFFAAITLFVGAFLIYLTLSMAVIERVRVYGTMRALGASRGQVRRLVVTEALVLGAFSTVLGLLFGLLIARGLIAMIGGLFQIDIEGLTVPAGAISAAVAVGLVTTLVSALVPAVRASRLAPVVAMRGEYSRETRLSRAWIGGIVAAAFGLAMAFAGGEAGGAVATPLILLGAVLLVPPLLRPLARLLGRLTNRLARGVGDVAVLHLVKERSRSAYTLALIMVVMAMIFSIGGMQASVARALDDSLDRQFGADLQVSTVGFGRMDPAVEDELRAIEGVGPVTAMSFAFVHLRGPDDEDHQTFVRVLDPETYFDVESFLFSDGTERDARRALAAEELLMPELTARSMDLAVGDVVRLNTAEGERSFRLTATYVFLRAGPPEVIVGLPAARRLLGVEGISRFHLNVTPGSDIDAVAERIRGALAGRYNIEVQTALALKQEARTEIGRFFNIFYAILLVAGIVGLLGLANTLAMSVIQRFREIGVLRAVGTTRGQVRRMVLVESATLGAVAFVLALPLGYLLSVLVLEAMQNAFGFEIAYVYPAAWILPVLLFGAVVAALAAFAPGRRAARLEVVTALQYE